MSEQTDKVNEFANKLLPEEYREQKLKVVDSDVPDMGRIDLTQQISQIAREVGMVLRDANFFYFGKQYVTIDEVTGEIEDVDSVDFCTWVEDYVVFYRWKGKDSHVCSIPEAVATKILKSRQLRKLIRPLKAVNESRFPVDRGNGVELLPIGYDKETCVYTVPVIEYDTGWSLEDAKEFLNKVYGEFPWYEQESSTIFETRSFAAQMAAALGTYCRLMLPESCSKPLVIWQGNQPGCGKSLLLRMALSPVYGPTEESTKPKSDDEFRSLLGAITLSRKPYLVLDDVKYLASNDLNQFITSPIQVTRVKGKSETRTHPNICQVFSTGNQLKLSYDLDRRSLVVDLFDPGRSVDRDIKKPITANWLWKIETRGKFLSALHAFVHDWNDRGRPDYREVIKKSFEPFSLLVGSICISGGLVNPFGHRENTEGGDVQGRALETLLAELVGELNQSGIKFTVRQIVEEAERRDYLDTILPFSYNDSAKALGQQLAKLRGRQLKDSLGRLFEFGRRRVRAGSAYEVRLLAEESLEQAEL